MGIAERKSRHKEELRLSILTAAWDMVISEGWQSLSIRKIADAIEYSIPVIYNHFENKEAILLEFSKEGYQLLANKLEEAKVGQNSPEEQLKAMADAYWDFSFAHKEYYQLMFGLGIPACEMVNQHLEIKEMTTIMMTTIQEAILISEHPDADYFLKFHTYWSILHGLVSIQLINSKQDPSHKGKLVLQDAMHGFCKSLL